MKSTAPLLLLLALLASFPPASRGERSSATRPGANVPGNSDTITDAEFAKKVVEVFRDCQQVQAGMTRGELVKLDILDEDFGPLHPVADKSFRQHAKFEYRSCSLIKVDVDFGPTPSEQTRPTDVITKVSMPYIDARPRR